MNEEEVKTMLLAIKRSTNQRINIEHAVQTAKQIGSSWATARINLICHDTAGNGRFRMVIE